MSRLKKTLSAIILIMILAFSYSEGEIILLARKEIFPGISEFSAAATGFLLILSSGLFEFYKKKIYSIGIASLIAIVGLGYQVKVFESTVRSYTKQSIQYPKKPVAPVYREPKGKFYIDREQAKESFSLKKKEYETNLSEYNREVKRIDKENLTAGAVNISFYEYIKMAGTILLVMLVPFLNIGLFDLLRSALGYTHETEKKEVVPIEEKKETATVSMSIEDAVILEYKKGLRRYQIAQKLNVHHQKVSRILKAANVQFKKENRTSCAEIVRHDKVVEFRKRGVS